MLDPELEHLLYRLFVGESGYVVQGSTIFSPKFRGFRINQVQRQDMFGKLLE
jgi:hypothetical protein